MGNPLHCTSVVLSPHLDRFFIAWVCCRTEVRHAVFEGLRRHGCAGLATAMSALPTQVASAQPPSTQVVVPATGATVSGTQVVLDATASAGVTQVKFELTGGTLNDWVIATATPTIYGWIALWNSTTVVSGTYTLQSVATADGSSATSPGISITVEQWGTDHVVRAAAPYGGTVSGTQAVFDAVGPAGVTGVGSPTAPLAVPPGRRPARCTHLYI